MFVFLSGWMLRYGLEVVARCNIVFVVIIMAMAVFTVVLLLKDMKLTNFLPVFEVPLKDFMKAAHIIGAGSFQIVVFLMIAPYVNKLQEVKRVLLFGLLFGGVYLLLLEMRNTAVLGPLEPFMSFASYRAVRVINIGDILTRLEVLVSLSLLLSLFMRICMSYYATVLGAAQLLGLRSYSSLVFPIGVIIINITLVAFDSNAEQAVFDMQVMPFYFFLFEFVIPLISLAIIMFRGEERRQKALCRKKLSPND
jgi:spore germination protein KB